MMDPDTTKGGRFVGSITMLFIVLKFTGIIHWSWIWIISPLWLITVVAVLAIVFYDFFPDKGPKT